MNRLILIDGNAILHRAYHALPLSISHNGEPTNAIYGFVSIVLKVIEDLLPTYLAICFDRPGGTFRNKLYKEYQAHRPKVEDSFISQIAKVHEVVAALNIPFYEKDGFEADDVIGTITSKIRNSKSSSSCHAELVSASKTVKIPKQVRDDNSINEIIIVTGDRDLLQLVTSHVKLYMPVKGLNEAKLYGEKETESRMGVMPSQIVDLKALMGDSSDNYPGVVGIGPKTAINLLKEFTTIENIYNSLDKIKNPKLVDKLIQGKNNAFISKKLAQVVMDVPIDFDTEKARLPEDLLTQKVIDVFGDYGFKTLLKRLSNMTRKEIQIGDDKTQDKKIEEKQMSLF